jgi:lysophospholipase L1-like esterase
VQNKDYVQSHFEFCAKNGWTKSANDGHPSEQGHHRWADELHQFIKQKNLV